MRLAAAAEAAEAGAADTGSTPSSGLGVKEVQRRLAAAAEAAASGGGGPAAPPPPSVSARAALLAGGDTPTAVDAAASADAATVTSSGLGVKEAQRRLASAAAAGPPAAPTAAPEGILARIERLRTAGERAAAEKAEAAGRATLATTVKRFEAGNPADDAAVVVAEVEAAGLSDVDRDALLGRLARGDATGVADVRAALLRRQVVGAGAGSGLGSKAPAGGVWELLGRAKARHAGVEEASKRRLGWEGATRKGVSVLEREMLAAMATWAGAAPPGGDGLGGGGGEGGTSAGGGDDSGDGGRPPFDAAAFFASALQSPTATAATAAAAERDAASGVVVDADARLRRVAELTAANREVLAKMRTTVALLGKAEASRAAVEEQLQRLGL